MIAEAPARRRSVDRKPPTSIVPLSYFATAMGGRLAIHLDAGSSEAEARAAARRAAGRIELWAGRLTRHSDASELIALNSDPRSEVEVGPTLAAALRAGRTANEASEGLADITLLDARLAAEDPEAVSPRVTPAAVGEWPGEWSLSRGARGTAKVRRPPGLHFDLGGVGKGWIADRAIEALAAWPSCVVDADGDMAIRCAPGRSWEIGVDDPRYPDALLATLHLGADGRVPERWGVATSGTSVHRWDVGGHVRHHIIDPRTHLPAVTDVVQATVVAGSALIAEALAKAVVIAGTVDGFALLERSRVLGAVVLTDRGETFALPNTLPLLAG